MKRYFPACTLGLLLLAPAAWGQGLRQPVWAGQFYDARPDYLSRQLDDLLTWADARPDPASGLAALIIPHAGYAYSGPVAAHAYALIQGAEIETVVILGVAHRHGFSGASIYPSGGYVTPLGTAEVDEPTAAALSKATGYWFVAAAHREEHSIEVQVPFIQKVLPGAKIVPVLMGLPSQETVQRLSKALAEVLAGTKALVIVSSDMSHYLSKKEANARDAETIALLQAMDTDLLMRKAGAHDNIMCGGAGAATALTYAQHLGRPRVEVLEYADSSARGGDESRVVGYLSAAIYADGTTGEVAPLSASEKQELLRIARTAVEWIVRDNRVLEPQPENPGLHSPAGAFVTLTKQGRLRGCIGFVEPIAPLCKTVTLAAIYAATRDNRFPPVTSSELKSLEVEISVLSVPRKISDPNQIKVGKHGLIISLGDRRGLLLPQVPIDNGWDRQTFLRQACLKAGLPQDAWRSGAEIRVFQAQVFR
jgi:AmmeMemoRadiSam system protein B/AmmeMemoRadiSam system protein A